MRMLLVPLSSPHVLQLTHRTVRLRSIEHDSLEGYWRVVSDLRFTGELPRSFTLADWLLGSAAYLESF